MSPRFSCHLVSLFLALFPAARAATLLGTLPATPANGTTVDPNNRFAVTFTTPATSFTVDSVTMRLSSYNVSDVPTLSFYTDGGTVPGSLVGSAFDNPSPLGDGVSEYSFTPSGTVALNPNTKYWLVYGMTTGSSVWNWSGSSSDPTGLATFNGYKLSSDTGTSYVNDNSVQFGFAINATAIPEPSTYAAIAACCALGIAMVSRRSKRGVR
jgi:hypothetical protein